MNYLKILLLVAFLTYGRAYAQSDLKVFVNEQEVAILKYLNVSIGDQIAIEISINSSLYKKDEDLLLQGCSRGEKTNVRQQQVQQQQQNRRMYEKVRITHIPPQITANKCRFSFNAGVASNCSNKFFSCTVYGQKIKFFLTRNN